MVFRWLKNIEELQRHGAGSQARELEKKTEAPTDLNGMAGYGGAPITMIAKNRGISPVKRRIFCCTVIIDLVTL